MLDVSYAAVQAWLALDGTDATQRAYRKEAERLILWAIVERWRALSSLHGRCGRIPGVPAPAHASRALDRTAAAARLPTAGHSPEACQRVPQPMNTWWWALRCAG